VSYRIVFAADARSDWGRMSVDVQEAVLDELDRLADTPSFPASAVEVTYRLTYEAVATRYGLSLSLGISHLTNTITVLGVDYSSDPAA
jgi:hypothetical protein